jgi:hypothetical protein
MARYRIVKRCSFLEEGVPVFEVEERSWFWWEPRGVFESFAEAEMRVANLIDAIPIRRQVIKEYD